MTLRSHIKARLSNAAAVIITTIVSLGFTSCAATKYLSENDVRMMDNAALVAPEAMVLFYYSDGLTAVDDSLSATCSALLTEAALKSGISIDRLIRVDGEENASELSAELSSLMNIDPGRAGEYAIPQGLDKLLEKNGKQYGVVVFANGFEKDAKLYRKQVLKSVLLGVATTAATLGSVTMYSDVRKNTVDTCFAILDSENDRIIFYNRNAAEISPVDAAKIDKQLTKLAKPVTKTLEK